jgi:hypothetical protein
MFSEIIDQRIVKRKYLDTVQGLIEGLGYAAAAGTIFLLIADTGLGPQGIFTGLGMIAFILIILGTALYRRLLSPGAKKLCLEYDRKYSLSMILSTAQEVDDGMIQSQLAPEIMKRALRKLEFLPQDRLEIQPRSSLMTLMLLPFLTFLFANPGWQILPEQQAFFLEEGMYLENLSSQLAQRAEEQDQDRLLELAQELDSIAKSLQRDTIDREKARELLQKGLDAVQRERDYLARRDEDDSSSDTVLDETLENALARIARDGMDGAEMLDSLQNMDPESFTPDQASDLAQSLGVDQESLEKSTPRDMAQQLKELIEERQNEEGKNELDTLENELFELSEKTFLEEGEDNEIGEGDKPGGEPDPDAIARGGGGEVDEDQEGQNNPAGSSAGTDPDESEPIFSSPPEVNENAVGAELRGQITREGTVQTLMRNMGNADESVLEQTDVRNYFSEQATEAIRRDDIPYEMQELVKRYFLQIGLVDAASTIDGSEENTSNRREETP